MASVSVTLDGAETLVGGLGTAATDLTDLTGVHQQLGTETLRAARIPVRTGELARSSYVDATSEGFTLSASAPYAGIVHARNPFFTDAMHARETTIIDGLADHAESVLDKIKGA